jgi:hypothetical protein
MWFPFYITNGDRPKSAYAQNVAGSRNQLRFFGVSELRELTHVDAVAVT